MPSRIRTHYLLIKRRWLYRCATTVSLKLSKVFNTKGFFIILNYTELTTAWKTVIELCSNFNEELKLGNFLMFSFFSSQHFGRRDVSIFEKKHLLKKNRPELIFLLRPKNLFSEKICVQLRSFGPVRSFPNAPRLWFSSTFSPTHCL